MSDNTLGFMIDSSVQRDGVAHPSFARSSSLLRYTEEFDEGPGGWWSWLGNFEGLKRLETEKSIVISRSPWWIDYNHAPPGAGYLHMLFCLCTKGPFGEAMIETAGVNAFVAQQFPRDFRNAELTFRLKGEILSRGAKLVLLVQSTIDSLTSGWVLTDQPLRITKDWSEQTLNLTLDASQWSCLGGRQNRRDYYGYIDLETVLKDVNCNIMLIFFPLSIKPMGPVKGDPHVLRPGKDYPVWTAELPEGYVMLDRIDLLFSPSARLVQQPHETQ